MSDRWIVSFLFIVSLFSGIALAEPSTTLKSSSSKTIYNFDEIDILGQIRKSNFVDVESRPDLIFRRLLDLDTSFLPDITKSVDEI